MQIIAHTHIHYSHINHTFILNTNLAALLDIKNYSYYKPRTEDKYDIKSK